MHMPAQVANAGTAPYYQVLCTDQEDWFVPVDNPVRRYLGGSSLFPSSHKASVIISLTSPILFALPSVNLSTTVSVVWNLAPQSAPSLLYRMLGLL